MRALVTGGLGFIGSNFIRYMLSKYDGVEIINIDNESYGSSPSSLKELHSSKNYRFVRGDITDYELISRSMEGVEIVVHLAAQTHVDRSISNPKPFFHSNALGTMTLLEAARRRDVEKFVHISTDEIHGPTPEGASFKEDDRLRPSSPYAASKAAAESFVQAYHKTYGLKALILRPTNNFGPYQFPEKLVPKTVIMALQNLPVPIYGDGMQLRDWIYVLDLCGAIDMALERGRPGEIYNVSAGNELPNLRVAEMILDLLKKPRSLIEFVEDRPGHDFRYSLDSMKIREELGWGPKYEFDKALASTVRWYVDNEWWWGPLASGKVLSPTPWRDEW